MSPTEAPVKLFAVFKEGVYRHECFGIFDTLEAAIARAREAASKDCDGYHLS